MINSSFWAGKKILLTGHTGFKGSWLLSFLIKMGAEVWGYSLYPQEDKNLFKSIYPEISSNFSNNIGDIRDLNELSSVVKKAAPDIVFHLAAQPLVRESYLDPLNTWNTNVIGTLNLLESLKNLNHKCAAVFITTDKVYKNKEWVYGYRENDAIGGHDPYSASKAASEIAIESWKNSFCGKADHQKKNLLISSARAGNVIGGGDWSKDRIVPDAIRAIIQKRKIIIRNPEATRPWQHVLDPLNGYLLLAEKIYQNSDLCTSFNFGPLFSSNRKVIDLINSIIEIWPAEYFINNPKDSYHEANLLMLQIDKAKKLLGWHPIWNFEETILKTVNWYKDVEAGADPYSRILKDLDEFLEQTIK